MIAYRIVEKDGEKYKTLFHGIRRSRRLYVGVWYDAERRWVRDGSGQEPYLSGFNVLLTRENVLRYLERFTAPRELRIARCEVEALRVKPTNPDVYLADRLKILSVED